MSSTTARLSIALAALLLAVTAAPAQPPAAGESACIACHSQFDEELARTWSGDVHSMAGLGCQACHGGDPSPGLAEDEEASMSTAMGFRPAPDRLQVAEFCAGCHSNASFMKRFDPQARVDQLAEYRTSAHGQANAKGDPVPATCTDCHGAHDIRPVSAPDSSVYATNVPETCAGCHADAAVMEPYGLPTGQYDDYVRSVHALVLFELGDVAAPACNDCHGNHGAVPPGVQSVANVCGQCHGREAILFRASFKKDLFESMDVAECTVCHGHHRVRHPSPELFHGAVAPTVSAGTVVGTDPFRADLGEIPAGGAVTATWLTSLKPHIQASDDRFVHRVEVAAEGHEPLVLDATVRPGAPLPSDESLRAGSEPFSAALSLEPVVGEPVASGDAIRHRLEVVAGSGGLTGVTVRDLPGPALEPLISSACLTCHSPGDECDVATERMYGALISLESDLRQAETLLHRAEVSGMEVGAPRFELRSKGVTSAVEARALIHAFDPDRLIERTEEGNAVAAAALQAGEGALAERDFRRKGLGISLVLIALVVVALYLKIRQVDRRREEAARAAGD